MKATMPATSDSADIARRLLADGYVVVTGMMDAAALDAARADLDRVLSATPTGRNAFEGFTTQRVYALFAKTRMFDQAAVHPLLLAVLDQVLGHYQLSAPVGIRIGPGERAQILHRDDAIYPVPEPHPPLVVNTMWPLDPFTTENGATRFIPGSHAWPPGRVPAADDLVETAVLSPGSAMFYLGSLWHGGGANRTPAPRLGVILEYAAGWLRQQENHCLAVSREVARELPERLQELLGYNIYPPFVGYVDGSHPRKVLSAGPEVSICDRVVRIAGGSRHPRRLRAARRCPMKQYLISVYQPDTAPPPPEVLGPIMERVASWRSELAAAGAWVFTGALQPASTATVLRVRDGEAVITDGPFTEGKEHVGGFTVVRAADLDEALAWSRKFCDITGLPVEVRPLADAVGV